MNKTYALIEKLKTPAREFSPMPFWFLNDDFTDEEIIRQLTDFNAHGVHGVVLHPRIGVPESIQYLSDKFMHFMKVAVENAARLDMKVILYDEAMYPSGSAHGLVVAANPKFASQAIILADNTDEGKLISKTESGKYIMQVNSNGKIRGIHFGEDDGQPNAPLAADLLNQESVDKFIELTHERYYAEVKKYFGNTVIGFFTDEPSSLGRGARRGCFPWTWGFEDVITSLGGKLSDLEGLYTGENNETIEIYKKALFDRENDIYYKSLSTWCENHGIALMGHPHKGDDIECEKYFHVPGQDIVLRWIAPEKGGLSGGNESAQGKCSADAARVMGRRRNSNECYGACCKDNIPWNFNGGDLKWYTDWLGVRGVNFFIPHAFYYSVTEKRKDERPPDVGPNNIWWKHFGTIATYIKRISCLMTDSKNATKVVVPCKNRELSIEEVAPLYENQVEFNYVPESFITEENVKDGVLTIGENSYEYAYFDKNGVLPTLKQAKDISELPERTVYLDKPFKDLRATHIIEDGVDVFFFTNEGEEEISAKAKVDAAGQLVAMDFWKGTVKEISCKTVGDKTEFNLNLKRRESIAILVDETKEAKEFSEEAKVYVNPAFTLVSDDEENFVKTYEAKITVEETENVYLKVTGEEMAECFVNTNFCGFSLWNEHEFYLTPLLKKGENAIMIKMTGSAVNRFTDHRFEYGLM